MRTGWNSYHPVILADKESQIHNEVICWPAQIDIEDINKQLSVKIKTLLLLNLLFDRSCSIKNSCLNLETNLSMMFHKSLHLPFYPHTYCTQLVGQQTSKLWNIQNFSNANQAKPFFKKRNFKLFSPQSLLTHMWHNQRVITYGERRGTWYIHRGTIFK